MKLRVTSNPEYDVEVERHGNYVTLRQRGVFNGPGPEGMDEVNVRINLVPDMCAAMFLEFPTEPCRVGGVWVNSWKDFVRVSPAREALSGVEIMRAHVEPFVVGLLAFIGEDHEHHS